MQHLDEHTIELYILGSDLVKDQIHEIEVHISECHGCRSLAGQTRIFYENAKNALEVSDHLSSEPSKAIIKRQVELDFTNETFTFPMQPSGKRYLARFLYFVYRHPISAAIGGFALIAILVGGINFAVTSFKDKNPDSVHYNLQEEMLDVYNKNGELIWRLPTVEGTSGIVKVMEQNGGIHSVVQDLDGNGKKEVITILKLKGNEIKKVDAIHIFSANKELLREIQLNTAIEFQGTKYFDEFSPTQFFIDNSKYDLKKEFYVIWRCNRSPTVLTRIDQYGNIIGQYWHFGVISGMEIYHLDSDENRRIILFGRNDSNEKNGEFIPIISVIDPSKIFGNNEASASRGFGFMPTQAERYYIRIPQSDLDSLQNPTRSINYCTTGRFGDRESYNFIVQGLQTNSLDFEYIFSPDMRLLTVKSASLTDILHDRLVKEGKLKGKIDSIYLDNLKKGVRYWDGIKWQKEWTMVKK
jgi:hypothetical protein